uniref:INO80 complex subunit E n=1 Tax=Sander lucioperca TaxID=283035 RepID=A0A8D0AQQ5_SANLU
IHKPLPLVLAAAAAVWLLAMLGPGLSLPAEGNSEPGFSLCSHCFYRQTPPQGASAGSLLRPLCYRLAGGQAFATLSKPTCDTAVYSAFHLSHGWTEKEGEEGKELAEEEEDNIKVAVPALLRGDRNPSHAVSPTDSLLQHWDSTVTTLVQSSITPQCNEECQTKPLWSAVCCAVPDGKSGFSMGLIRETGQEERQVSVKELEEMLGVSELFSEGCGGADEETVGIRVGLHSEGLPGNINKLDADSNEHIKERRKAPITEELVAGESSADYEAVDEQETDTNSSSTLVYVLCTTMSILTAPLQPVFSRVTQLPGQVTYVLQEDLGVLSALPGETFSLLHLLTSDFLSWMGLAGETLLGIGENCFSSVYYCSSSMLGALLNSCETGVTGMGTLAGDTVGIFSDALDNAWWVTKFFGGWLWEQIEGYIGTVLSEMGGQVKAVGGGVEKLAFRSGNRVGNVFKLGGGLITGMVDMVIGAVREAFGQESDELQMSYTYTSLWLAVQIICCWY